ncbi:MAG: DUF192 domain-containing protein [Armatimonadota bacterium]|nr:DUF192 domain-containing protein [Armatimonadota bacterium]MDT7972628.1 DUF192 domain-containing protein [Armatimonadota bacterium]
MWWAKVINLRTGKVLCERCAIATSYWLRLRGWMFRRNLAPEEGLLLAPALGGVHTLFLFCPIDVAYLDRRCKVVALRSAMPPWRVWIPRHRDALLALELPSGRLAETQTQIGDRLEIVLVAWR